MYIPPQIKNRLASLNAQLQCELNVTRCWQSEGDRPVLYANFKGVVSDAAAFRIEVGGTVCCEPSPDVDDLVDLFIFLNGRRLTCAKDGSKYLIGRGDSLPNWDFDDDAYLKFTELTENSFCGPIASTMQIIRDSTDTQNDCG